MVVDAAEEVRNLHRVAVGRHVADHLLMGLYRPEVVAVPVEVPNRVATAVFLVVDLDISRETVDLHKRVAGKINLLMSLFLNLCLTSILLTLFIALDVGLRDIQKKSVALLNVC